MKKHLLIFFSLLLSLGVHADPTDKDKESKETSSKDEVAATTTYNKAYSPPLSRRFDDIDSAPLNTEAPDRLIADNFDAPLPDTLEYYKKRALELDEFISSNDKFVDILDEKTLIDMPVGLKKDVGGLRYSISLDSIVMTPQGAYLIAYMVFEEPSSGKKLAFRGTNIKLTKNGGLTGNARLELIGNQSINLFGEKSLITLRGDGSTYVDFDCNGFKMMGVGADILFSRDLFIPENPDGSRGAGRLKTSFTTTLSNWNDLIVEVNMPVFQVKDLEGVGFRVKTAVFDFSDYRNAPAVKFPEDYQSPALIAGVPNLWRGFYLRELSISLPKQFKSKGSSERKKFGAYDVLIDNMGFTGSLVASNIIQKQNGDMNGWTYSLDKIAIDIEANRLTSGSFSGDIIIPVSKEDKAFQYSAIINTGNEYIFNVESADSIEFAMFKTSKVEIFPSSYLEIKVKDGEFRPKANLHGTMNIKAELGKGKKGVELADISFENLEIQSVKPYIKVGNFSFGSEAGQQAMANFPVSINNIGMKNISDTEVGLDFDLLLNLTGSDGGAFAADAGLTIVGEMPSADEQKWVYKDIEVRKIAIDIDGGAFKFKGSLTFYKNDVVYGEGFNGQVDAEFKPGIKVKATAIFGNVDGYRYWYADALASFPGGVPIFTGVGVYGFGGGAYYRMAMDTEGAGSDLGRTVSGIVYVPKENAGLGLKATIEIGSHPKPEAFNGDATFEVAFFKGGGIRYISFKGNGYMATPPADGALAKLKEKTQKLAAAVAKAEKAVASTGAGVLLASNPENDQTTTQIYGQIGDAAGKKGQISAHVFISYDFENRVLHGNFEAYMNVAGGLIKGVGDGGRAGWAVLHFAPDEWYVYVGTPDDRIGLSMGVGPIRAEATSYFMVGTSIPGSPPPPQNVSDILGGEDLDYMRDLNALGNGAGFAFGASFGVDTGDMTFLMFYARLAAGAGFDIMLKDYGNASCVGRSGPIGINGWYANGQAYAYFEGKVGIKVKVFGKRKKIDILSLGAAAVLQAKLPNPFWMKGVVGGYFSVLGGLVKGNCKFEVTLGEECELVGVGSAVEGIKVIAEVTPNEGEKEVSVFNTPQAVFNMPVDEVFEMIDLDGKKKSFRIKLDEFKLVSGGYEVPGETEWNDHHDVMAFNSFDIFPSEKEMKVIVQVSFEEKVSGSWTPVIVDGKKYTERMEAMFTSGEAPDYIPLENVKYSYPVVNQLNFYKDEYNKGYIKLKKGQPDLFKVDDEWVQKGRFTTSGGSPLFFNYTYTNSSREVNFNLPSNLKNDQIYAFELVNLPAKEAAEIDRNISDVSNNFDSGDQEIDMEMTTKEAEGVIAELQEKAIFTSYFRSSSFSTLENKLSSGSLIKAYSWGILPGIDELKARYLLSEAFDKYEINNEEENLIVLEASMNNNNWYVSLVKPLVYDDYPIQGKLKLPDERVASYLGVPPSRAVYIIQETDNLELDIEGEQPDLSSIPIRVLYNLAYEMNKDYMYLLNQVANESINVSTPRMNYFLLTPFPVLRRDHYSVRMQYYLPGIREKGSGKTIIIDYTY
ncbi:hypothetical protein GCM10009122_38820 [Fulvivirga kasyanovii]|uniref:Uncharacterized protein n=1 Tax=Fulvivirga kasyanovii TaxID=396812 RepID=A0ABW9RS95_9BACT|nr:hypothetical protein [Fulvivirga kasyanovii]MTI27039.1 hypothetical protein [Fulvivirga kasyanovii]